MCHKPTLRMVHSTKFVGHCIGRGISSVGLEHYLDRVGVTGSNPVCPTFILPLKTLDINIWIRTAFNVLIFGLLSLSSIAYEPGVSELESRIIGLESELAKLEVDSTASSTQVVSIKDSIIELQGRIVEMKESTINGLRRQQSLRKDNRETLGVIAFGMLLVALLSIVFVILFGKRFRLQEGVGLMQILADDLQRTVSPDKEKNKGRTRVHFLVWFSVIIMFSSMVMYLFRVL